MTTNLWRWGRKRGHKRRWLLWTGSYSMPTAPLCHCPGWAAGALLLPRVTAGTGVQFSVPLRTTGEAHLDETNSAWWYKFLATCSLQNPIISKVTCWEGKSSNMKNFNLHWQCVCVQTGERSSKTNGSPCFETDSSFIWFIWQVYIRVPYLITEQLADIFEGEGRRYILCR